MINSILPNNIACEIIYDSFDQVNVHIDEILAIQQASPDRIIEFLNGRNTAHLALNKLKFINNSPILIGKNREPLWPENTIGSITHCLGYCAAAVAYKKNIIGIGIDAELNSKINKNIIPTTQTPIEQSRNIKLQLSHHDVCINKIVFSAKESTFKFIYPFIQHYISFNDIEIHLNTETKSFSISFIKKELYSKFMNSKIIGKFDYNDTHIVTSVYESITN